MKFYSLCILSNIILVLVAIFLYYNSNFDSVSKKNLIDNYISKDLISFKDLPKNERIKYISKAKLNLLVIPFIDLNKTDLNENDINSTNELRELIRDLKYKIQIVQNDNIELSNSKEEMKNMIKKIKKDFLKQKNIISEQNKNQINETEQQHYKNISKLTDKINDLKKQNIKLFENNNIEIIALKTKINILNNELSKNKENKK